MSDPAQSEQRLGGARLLAASVIVLLTLVAYWPAITGGGFIWDDDSYVTKNRLLAQEGVGGLRRIWWPDDPIQPRSEDADSLRFAKFWFKPETPQYYPVVFTTFWVEWRLWGDEPRGYHTVNVLLHAANAVLIWLILLRLKVLGGAASAWIIAAIFALHPIHVESVAWITERKNTLSMFFYLLAAIAYLRFDSEHLRGSGREVATRGVLYAASLLLFILALLSKSVTCSLPAALILVMLWQRKAMTLKRLAPLVPFFVIGFVLAMNTALIERELVGAQGPDFDFTFLDRTLIASRALLFYTSKIIWPHPLMFIYPRWEIYASAAVQYVPLVIAVIIGVALVWMFIRSVRGPFIALLFFAGTVFPALGYFNVYPHIFSFVADHFVYHASVGLIAFLVCAAAYIYETRLHRQPHGGSARFTQPWASVHGYLTVPLLVILLALTWRQSAIYESAESVYRHTLARNADAWMPHNNLASILLERADAARQRGEERVLRELAEEARVHAERAIAIRSVNHPSHSNRAEALRLLGQYAEALPSIRQAQELAPHFAEYWWQEGRLLHLLGRFDEAAESYRHAVEQSPHNPTYRHDYAAAMIALGRHTEAAEQYERMLELQPDHFEIIVRLGAIYFSLDQHTDAERLFRRGVDEAPTLEAYMRAELPLIRLLATSHDANVRDTDEAIERAARLAEITGRNDPGVLSVLAAVYHASGDHERAVATVLEAIEMAQRHGLADMEAALHGQLSQYRNRN